MNEKLFKNIFSQGKIIIPKLIFEKYSKLLEESSYGTVTAKLAILDEHKSRGIIPFTYSLKSESTGYSYRIFSGSFHVLGYPCTIYVSNQLINKDEIDNDTSEKFRVINDTDSFDFEASTDNELEDLIDFLFSKKEIAKIVLAIYSQS